MIHFLFSSGKKTIIFLPCFVTLFTIIILNGGNVLSYTTMTSDLNLAISNNEINTDANLAYGMIPSNVSIEVEPKDAGTLYLSASISNNTVNILRDLNDELFPFQIVNWYQLVKLEPRYNESFGFDNITNNTLIAGELQDFDNFDQLLGQARIYNNVPLNETFILDIPNRDVSFMQIKLDFANGSSYVYYGLYDGNQQPDDKSEAHLRLNPESSLKIPESVSALDIKNDDSLFNITKTFVCNDLYKLGYEKCQ